MRIALYFVFSRLAIGGILLYLLGLFLDNVWLVLSLGMAAYIAWTLWNIYRLLYWLQHGNSELPETFGIWESVFQQLYNMHAKNRKNKRRLSKMLKRFRKSTQAVPDATVVLNKACEIQWFNQAARQYLQLRQPEDIGQRIDNLIRHPDFLQHLKTPKHFQPVELTINNDVLLIRIVPIDQKNLLLTAQDITQRYRLEIMRRDFIANASHELRTPLTVISGYIEQLYERRQEIDSSWHKPISKIQEQTKRMQSMIEDLLLLSRLENPKRNHQQQEISSIKLTPLLNSIYQEAQELSKNRHTIKLNSEDISLIGNEKEYRIAFTNLVFNAIHYTQTGGTIEIKTYRDDQGCHFSVKDTGIGIDAIHISRLTERFYRIDGSRRGTGLGLAIVQQILERHHARLYIESDVGKGSLFRCDFTKQH